MPTYSYICDACGHHFDRFQSVSDDPVDTCPNCGVQRVRRLIRGGSGLIFKGTGFYITDYARKSHSGGNGQPKTAKSDRKESPQTEKSTAATESKSSPSKDSD